MELRAQPDFSLQLRQRARFATFAGSQASGMPVKGNETQPLQSQWPGVSGGSLTFGAVLPDNFNPERLVQSVKGTPRKPYQIQLTSRRPFQAGAALTGLSALGLATPLACLSFLGIPAGMTMMGISALGWGQAVPANVARALRANASSDPSVADPKSKSSKTGGHTLATQSPVSRAEPQPKPVGQAGENSIKLPDTSGLLDSLLKPRKSDKASSDPALIQTEEMVTIPHHPPVTGQLEPLMEQWFPPLQLVSRQTKVTGLQNTVDTRTVDEFGKLLEQQGLSPDSLRAKLALAGERRKVQAVADKALTTKREQLRHQNLADNVTPALLNGQGLQPTQAVWLKQTGDAVAADLAVEPGAPDARVMAYPHGKTPYAELTLAAATQLLLQEKEAYEAQRQQKHQVHQRERARFEAQQANDIRHILHETVHQVVSEDGLSAKTRINGQRMIQALTYPDKAFRWEQARAAGMTRLLGDDLPEQGRIQPFEVAQALLRQGQVRPAQHWERVLLQIAHGDGRIPVAYEVQTARPVHSPTPISQDGEEPIAQAKIVSQAAGNPVGQWWHKVTQPLTTGVQVSRLPAESRSGLQDNLTQAVVTIPTQAPVSEYVRAINVPAIVGPLVIEKQLAQRNGTHFLTHEQQTAFDQIPNAKADERTQALAYLDQTARITPANIWQFIDGVRQVLDTASS